jgi:hypothetical protein
MAGYFGTDIQKRLQAQAEEVRILSLARQEHARLAAQWDAMILGGLDGIALAKSSSETAYAVFG